MDRRAFDRISVNIYARFFSGRILQTGIITNLSKNGMRIDSRVCIPRDSIFDVHFTGQGMDLKIPVTVKRSIGSAGMHRGMGVEILEQPRNYSDLVIGLRTALRVLRHPLSHESGRLNDTTPS